MNINFASALQSPAKPQTQAASAVAHKSEQQAENVKDEYVPSARVAVKSRSFYELPAFLMRSLEVPKASSPMQNVTNVTKDANRSALVEEIKREWEASESNKIIDEPETTVPEESIAFASGFDAFPPDFDFRSSYYSRAGGKFLHEIELALQAEMGIKPEDRIMVGWSIDETGIFTVGAGHTSNHDKNVLADQYAAALEARFNASTFRETPHFFTTREQYYAERTSRATLAELAQAGFDIAPFLFLNHQRNY